LSEDVHWVDANVLLRFLTGEPEEMAEKSERLFERARRGEVSLRVHSVVVAEAVWVLQSYYGHPRPDIAASLVPLLAGRGFKVEGATAVAHALETMAEKNVDFADALLAESARFAKQSVASFDRDFRKLGVESIEPE
jgi:predicted nucleic-acid-binding protein